MTDRIAGLVGIAFAIVYGVTGASFSSRLRADPLGPNAFPVLLSMLLVLFCLALVIRPSVSTELSRMPFSAKWRAAVAIGVMVAYGILLEPLGFVLASCLLVTALSLLMRATWLQACASGTVASTVLYLLFNSVFGLPLPTGAVFAGLGAG